jgi:hypothetical protein
MCAAGTLSSGPVPGPIEVVALNLEGATDWAGSTGSTAGEHGGGRAQALLRRFDELPRRVTSPVGGTITAYDPRGPRVDRGRLVTLPPGGFAIAEA